MAGLWGDLRVRVEDDDWLERVLGWEIRCEEMDQHGVPESASAGDSGEAFGGSGDETSDDVGGDRRLPRGTERCRPSPRSPRHPRCHPPPRRRRFTSQLRLLHPAEAQEGAFFFSPRLFLFSELVKGGLDIKDCFGSLWIGGEKSPTFLLFLPLQFSRSE